MNLSIIGLAGGAALASEAGLWAPVIGTRAYGYNRLFRWSHRLACYSTIVLARATPEKQTCERMDTVKRSIKQRLAKLETR